MVRGCDRSTEVYYLITLVFLSLTASEGLVVDVKLIKDTIERRINFFFIFF